MWVERIELTNYAGVQGENIIFAQDKLNLVVEPNEYGKSTMATAIWSILYDYPPESSHNAAVDGLSDKEARRPKKGDTYAGRIDVYAHGRRLAIIRDFNANKFAVYDKEKNNLDVTADFLGPNGEDELGVKLTGMTRELFRSTCFVGQRELDDHAIGGENGLAAMVQGIADSSTPSATSGQAVKVLREILDRVPVGDKKIKFDSLIRDLEMLRQDLLNKIRAYERDKQDVAASFDRLMIVNKILAGDNSRFKAAEYQNLRAQRNLVDSKLGRLKEILVRKFEIEEQLEAFNGIEEFPEDLRKAIDELFERRAQKTLELQTLQSESNPHQQQYDDRRAQIKRRYAALDSFSQDEATMVASLAGSMHTVEVQINDLMTQSKELLTKILGPNGTTLEIESLRSSLGSVEGEGIEHARSYNSLIQSFQNQSADAERTLHKERARKKEYEQKLKDEISRRKLQTALVGGMSVALFITAVVVFFVLKEAAFVAPILLIVGIIGIISAFFISIPIFKPEGLYKNEFNQISHEIGRVTTNIQDLHTKTDALEIKLDTLARKVGLPSREQLVGRLEDYAGQAVKLREYDAVDAQLETKRNLLERYKSDLEKFVAKANKGSLALTANTAKQLSTALSTFFTETRNLEVSFQSTTSSIKKVAHLEEAIKDTEEAIANLLEKAGIPMSAAGNLSDAIEMVNKRLNSHGEFIHLTDELNELEHETGGHFVELPSSMKTLEEEVAGLVGQMVEMRETYPGIEAVTPAAEGEVPGEGGADTAQVAAMRKEREELQLRIRTLSLTCDEQYLHCIEELDLTEFKLASAKRAKLALEIAGDTLQRLSGETYVDWSGHLNVIARDMVGKLGLDYDEIKFDKDLKVLARKKGEANEMDEVEIQNQLSIGTKEQIHWLARMVVSKFLSRQQAMPIIMDEPFSEADDERFMKMMRFLIAVIAKDHQIIIFSCHQQRHTWFKNQLEEADRGKLLFCRRQKNVG